MSCGTCPPFLVTKDKCLRLLFMQFTDEETKEFVALWEQDFGEKLALHVARHRAKELIELYYLLTCRNKGELGGNHESQS